MKPEAFSLRVQIFAIVLLLAIPSGTVNAQNDQTVLLTVRVTDRFRRAIPSIGKEKFQISEDGVAQKIELFASEQAPVSYGLVIDNSGSLRTQFEAIIATGMKIVNSNTFEDQAFLIRFVGSDRMEVMQECTSDKRLLISGLQAMYVEGGQTALIDAVYLAAEKLAKLKTSADKPQRKALIVVTDGEDRQSYYKPDQLFSLLGATDIQVFVIGLTSEVEPKNQARAVDFINRLAMETGGRAFFPKSPLDLEFIGEAIISDIRTEYTVGYVPSTNSPADFHKLQISIAGLATDESIITITRLRYSGTVSP